MFASGATTRRRLGRAVFVAAVGAAAVALAAAPGGAQTQPNLPFARGQLVSKSGATLDIQGFNGDSKVIVTGSTKYQQMQSADASAVKVGECVRVTGTGSASKGIAATNVALSPAASKCTRATGAGGFGGGFGGGRFRNRNGGANGNANTGNGGQAPLGFGNNGGAANDNGGNGNGNRTGNANRADFGNVSGKVTKVSGDKVTVKGVVVQAPTKANAKPKMSTKTVAVTLSDSTRYSQTTTATADALTVGTCVTAAGTADSVGTVTANTVVVSQPVNGSCTGGFGFGGRGGFRGGPGGQGGQGGQNGAPGGTQGNGSNGTGTA
jgi:hypothetical protein